ncbi:hypothetical protein V1514DRAFT_317676 [Lipomyces japonicus]|uniref:uncharacterized protein n=1 Tax=Lipomyces japonicus TaxID=56871 RepID=UPI0034CE1326
MIEVIIVVLLWLIWKCYLINKFELVVYAVAGVARALADESITGRLLGDRLVNTRLCLEVPDDDAAKQQQMLSLLLLLLLLLLFLVPLLLLPVVVVDPARNLT